MSSKLYFRKSDVVQALRECADKARAEGFAAGRAEAERFLEFAARLNGSAPHVLKAIRGEELPPRKESPPADEDASPLDAATLAYIDALIEAKTHHADSDGGDVADVLRGWIEDPAALEAALGGEMLLKAFDEGKHPRDDGGRFVSKEAIHAAKSDPKKAEELRARVTDPEQRKKLDAAIGGETDLGRTKRGEQQQASEGRKAEAKKRFDRVRELKDAISAARRGGEEVPHTHFTELAEHLPHLTVSQLRSVRESLAASFFGRKRRDEMVTALVRHAKVRAEQMRAEQDAGDGLDFGMDAMSPAAAGGQGRAHDSDLNPWREFDKDKGYGEAQHGGRIGQRKQIMDAVSDGAKTSHGTPDLGSKLKQPDKMLDVRTLAPENKAGLTLDQQVKKDEPPQASLESVSARLDSLLGKGGEIDKANEELNRAKTNAQFHLHVHRIGDQFGVFHNPTTGRTTDEHLVSAFPTKEAAEDGWRAKYREMIEPHKAKVWELEDEMERLRVQEDEMQNSRPAAQTPKPTTQTDAVKGKDDAADDKYKQPHNPDEPDAGYTNAEPDADHVADIARARETDKKFRGEGRYEAEVWQKLRNSNQGKPMPPLSRDAAEWLADGYERDGKPIPDEVLKDNPDLRGQYTKAAPTYTTDKPTAAASDKISAAPREPAMKHLPVDKSASKKYAETGQAAAFRIHNAKYPLPKKSKSTWSGDESETMPGVSGYATMGGALGDMLFNQTESATGDNYTQQVMGDEGDKPSIVVMHGKEIDGPGAETIVPNPKIAAVFTMGQVEHMASELAKSRGATGDSWEELSKSIEWEDRDAFNDALAEKMRQSNPSTIPEATSRKPKPAPQKPAAEDTELWQLPQKQYAENYYAGENFENHRRIIKEALAAGKSVPPEVLADYPDLAPKPPTAPQNPPKESEDVAPIAEPPAKKLGEKKTRKPSATDSLYDWTQHYGGIDPESHAFQTFFGSVNEARENGIPLGVFKKGGEGLDVIARQMLNSGHINAKDEVEAQQVLLDGLASKAYSYHADRTKDYDKALQNYERAKQEAADALNESSIREAERSGEAEADRGEPASGRGADQDSDAGDGGRQPGDAAEPIGEVDTSFDFGDSTPTSKSDAKNDAKASAQPSQKATPEQAAARKWQKNDDGTYTAPNGTVWRKAAAGGEVSPVTGQPFKGGHMMPVHGLSPKVEKPQTTGTGDAASVKPNEDAEGKRQPARSPMTPEQIEEERENRARQAKWDEMRGGVLGKLKHLTDKPMPLRNSTIDVDRWKQFADGVDEGKLKQIVDVLRKDRHDAIDADVVAQGQTNLDKDSIDWEKNSPERQSEIFPLSGKYRSKGKPSSNLARQHVQHALEDAKNPHDLHAIEKKLQGIVNAPAPSDTPVSPTQNAAPSAKPDASKTASPAAIPPDHAAALRDAAKHHRRMQMPGKPIPAHVVYTKPATKDATGKPLDPEETVAIPADSSGGERILAGKSPHYTVHGVYEFGPDGTPRIAEPR